MGQRDDYAAGEPVDNKAIEAADGDNAEAMDDATGTVKNYKATEKPLSLACAIK